MGRALSMHAILTKKFKLVPFTGKWQDSFGSPELSGTWIIWGQSGSGKTHFTLMLCKYLTQFGRVVYNSLEEGQGPTIQQALKDVGMDEVPRGSVLLVKESMTELNERLSRKKSPQIAVIDSIQYTGLRYPDYTKFKDAFPSKLLILISHAEGKEPENRTAKAIRYDAHIKIYVEGFRAFVSGRYKKNPQPFDIFPEAAAKYWGDDIMNCINK